MKVLFSKLWNASDKLAQDTIWAGSSDVLRMIFTLFSFTMLQRVLVPEEYGSYIAVYAISAPLGALTFSGPSLGALTSVLREKDDPQLTFLSFVSIALSTGALSLLFGFALASTIADELGSMEILFILGTELFASVTVFVYSAVIQARFGYGSMVRLRLGLLVIRFLVFSFLVALDSRLADRFGLIESIPVGIERFESLTILNMAGGYFFAFVLYSLFIVLYKAPKVGMGLGKPVGLKKSFFTSLTFAIPMTAGRVQTDADKVVLRSFGFAAETGLYGAAYRVVSLGMAPIRALDSAAFQRFLPDDENDKSLHMRRSMKFTSLMFSVSIALAAVIYFSLPFIDFLFDDRYKEAKDIVPWLLPFIPLLALSGTPMNGLIGLGRAKERSYLYIVSAIVSVTLYLIFVPLWGWKGAVAGTLASETFLAVISWIAMIHFQKKRDYEFEQGDNSGVN